MKKTLLILFFTTVGMTNTPKADAQAKEIAQLVLNLEKLAQFKQILSDLKSGYDIVYGGYNTIKNIAQGNFRLHQSFLDGLMQVSPAVRKYKRIAAIIDAQIQLVKAYKAAFNRFKNSGHFNSRELAYMSGIYEQLFKRSLRDLDELTTVVTAGKLRMSDDERLRAIDRIYAAVLDKLLFLQHFNNNTTILGLQRAKEQNDAAAMGRIYGIKPQK